MKIHFWRGKTPDPPDFMKTSPQPSLGFQRNSAGLSLLKLCMAAVLLVCGCADRNIPKKAPQETSRKNPEKKLQVVSSQAPKVTPPDVADVKKTDADWPDRIRRDHPRLFFNRDTWPVVKARALNEKADDWRKLKELALSPKPEKPWSNVPPPKQREGSETVPGDWGYAVARLALVQRIEPDPARLKKIKDMLYASLDYYRACYADNQAASWYGWTGICWLSAMDWIWDELSAQERNELGKGMLEHVDDILNKPNVLRRNLGLHGGFYGEGAMAWYVGLLFSKEGIDDERAAAFLQRGYQDHQEMLKFRSEAAGKDGGISTPVAGYCMAAYPYAEWNFFHAWQSALNEDFSGQWPYPGLFPNYVLWNWLPENHIFGYGDDHHEANSLTNARNDLYVHMSQIIHFYQKTHPEWAQMAAMAREKTAIAKPRFIFPAHPFITDDPKTPAFSPSGLRFPPARYFKGFGHVIMRSGQEPDDTYALFACGGLNATHRHYDNTHFTIYRKGFLILDTGTRDGNTDNLQNYYAQTVAHNCVMIKMPGEAPSPYWNGQVYGQDGGQNNILGGKVAAFETGPQYTYVAGDATGAYHPQKCGKMLRQFIFVPPFHFVVLDRVTSTKAEYSKRWLLHHANEPELLADKTWRSDQAEGRIYCRTLLPADAVLEKIGGPGKGFLADGVNYSIDAPPSKLLIDQKYVLKTSRKHKAGEVPELLGRWRMEIKPGTAGQEDLFLHLIQVGDKSLEKMNDAQLTNENGRIKLKFASGIKEILLEFKSADETGDRIKIIEAGKTLADKELARDIMLQEGLASPQS
ncbi:MAG: heparinase II/III family protein [Verrucomicrobiae bacterium]|nr:heparinase II/III family protein [Verrucomicrobiae bacterium]